MLQENMIYLLNGQAYQRSLSVDLAWCENQKGPKRCIAAVLAKKTIGFRPEVVQPV